MNLYKKTEELLYSYKTLVAEVKNLEIEISELEYIGCSGTSYEERTQSTNKFNSSVENEVIDRDDKIARLKKSKFLKENMVKRIDNALEVLEERKREIIKLCCIEKLPRKIIADRLYITESWVWSLKTEAINEISSVIYEIV